MGRFSLQREQNEAAKLATQKYLFFYDVDMDYAEGFEALLLQKIESQLESGKVRFLSLPFLYLTQEGTKFFAQTKNLEALKSSF